MHFESHFDLLCGQLINAVLACQDHSSAISVECFTDLTLEIFFGICLHFAIEGY